MLTTSEDIRRTEVEGNRSDSWRWRSTGPTNLRSSSTKMASSSTVTTGLLLASSQDSTNGEPWLSTGQFDALEAWHWWQKLPGRPTMPAITSPGGIWPTNTETGSNSMGNDFEKRLFDELAGNAAGQADILRIHVDLRGTLASPRIDRMMERVEVLRDLERRLSDDRRLDSATVGESDWDGDVRCSTCGSQAGRDIHHVLLLW